MQIRTFFFLAAIFCAAGSGPAHAKSREDFPTRAAAIVKEYLDWRPAQGVALGLHEYDGKAADRSAASIEAQLKWLKRTLAELDGFELSLSKAKPAGRDLYDARILRAALASEVFGIRRHAILHSQPDGLRGRCGREHLHHAEFRAVAGTGQVHHRAAGILPALFASARANLADVLPKPYIETAILIAQGSADFLAKDLVEALKPLEDETLRAAFKVANERAVAELKSYADWLRTEKLPKADAAFALGAKKYRRLLAASELVDLDPAEILKLGLAELKAEQARFAAAARVIDPSRTPIEVFKTLQHEHPTWRVSFPTPGSRSSRFAASSWRTNSFAFPAKCAPRWRRLCPSIAPPHSPRWTRRGPSKKWPPKHTIT